MRPNTEENVNTAAKMGIGLMMFAALLSVAHAQDVPPRDANGWRCGSIQQISEFEIKANDIRVNNLSVRERDEFFGSARVIEFSSIANRQQKSIHIDGQMAGFDSNGQLIFALHAEPMMSTVSEGKTDTATGRAYAMRDDLKRAAKICVKFMISF
jgi:hypothetical protein